VTGTIAPPGGPRARRGGRDGARTPEVVEEDPRIARRRREVAQERRHRRRRWVVAAAAVALVLVAGVLVTRSPLLDVDHVRVTGTSGPGGASGPKAHVTDAAVLRAAGVSTGDPMVGLDAAAVRRRIDAVPGVASARVTLDWPSTVRIAVTPEAPLARIRVGSTDVVVARGGRVLGSGAVAGDVGALPVIAAAGLDGGALRPGHRVPRVLADALVVFEQMPDGLRGTLGTAALDAAGDLTFTLPAAGRSSGGSNGVSAARSGGTVRFGPPEDVPAKLLAAASMLGGQVELACLDELDLREPPRATISRVAGCAVPAPTVATTSTTVPASTRTTSGATPRSSASRAGQGR
jgi:cell division protein FtsQ